MTDDAPIGGLPPSTGALALDTYDMGMRFGSFQALQGVSMKVAPGTVHALLGENGAGKSTLVKCVAGFQRPTSGSILIDGREQAIPNPVVARALGIGMVYQHFMLVEDMSVAENVLLGQAGGFFLDPAQVEMIALVEDLLQGFPAVDLDQHIGIDKAERQHFGQDDADGALAGSGDTGDPKADSLAGGGQEPVDNDPGYFLVRRQAAFDQGDGPRQYQPVPVQDTFYIVLRLVYGHRLLAGPSANPGSSVRFVPSLGAT